MHFGSVWFLEEGLSLAAERYVYKYFNAKLSASSQQVHESDWYISLPRDESYLHGFHRRIFLGPHDCHMWGNLQRLLGCYRIYGRGVILGCW